ncbi:MAG TPA: hypothetical protein VN663_07815 [Ramlibacter sp.]|nr:hypothetical protein [Ramlibacter sp.]
MPFATNLPMAGLSGHSPRFVQGFDRDQEFGMGRAAGSYETTTDPDLHLLADGERINASAIDEQIHYFELPYAPATLAIGSRFVTPVEVDAVSQDIRQLGVSVTRVLLRAAGTEIQIGHEHPLLGEGFHENEPSHRWTNGMGTIPGQFLNCLAGPVQVEVHIAGVAPMYPISPEAPAATAEVPAKKTGRKGRGGGHAKLIA